MRHGHISTLHIWPARRPLAACRAALLAIAAVARPGDGRGTAGLVRADRGEGAQDGQAERRGGRDGRGDSALGPGAGERGGAGDLRQRIRAAFGGQAPKVLDPFAGGGAIPLEAMRLGCEVTAVDINPVAWFILKCTLEYPQKLAGQTRPLPAFILEDREFMEEFFKAQGLSKAEVKRALENLGHRQAQRTLTALDLGQASLEADLAWHVRAWGQWVLDQARRELARFYPTYVEFEPLKPGHVHYEKRPLRLAPLTEDGLPDLDALNAEFAPTWLEDEKQPRWVAKPTVAYLWARTVPCKGCRATVPLLKTRWLAKKDTISGWCGRLEPTSIPLLKPPRRYAPPLLSKEGNKAGFFKGVVFGIETRVPARGKTAAQRKEHDKALGAGTMSRSGAKCPCCGVLMTMEDIRFAGRQGLGAVMTAVVVDG